MVRARKRPYGASQAIYPCCGGIRSYITETGNVGISNATAVSAGEEVKRIAETGIQILADHMAAGGGLQSLGAGIAIAVETGHATGLLRSFLMKKVRAAVIVQGGVADEAILIGMARGDATVTQIKAALEDVQLEDDRKTQAAKRDVLFETLTPLHMVANTVGPNSVVIEASLGGGGGIPFEKGDGWQWFAYNPDSGALSAGSQTLIGHATYWGIWL